MTAWVESIEIDHRARRSVCHVPDRVTPGLPLLIVLHGRNLTVDEMRRITHFDTIADRHGFVVAYPEGYKRSWNDGRSNSPAQEEGFDDAAFIRALIDRLGEKGIDTELVAATGLSNGGVMCQRLGLELSDRIGTIAPIAGLMPRSLAAVVPDHAVSVLEIHGTADRAAPIGGGRARPAAPVAGWRAPSRRTGPIARANGSTLAGDRRLRTRDAARAAPTDRARPDEC